MSKWSESMKLLREEYVAKRDEARSQIQYWRDTAMHFEGAIAALDVVEERMGAEAPEGGTGEDREG